MFSNQPYYQPYYQPNNQRFQPIDPQNSQLGNNAINSINQVMPTNNTSMLFGKVVDSIEVAKSVDIPLNGSVSYFPLANGSAIITRQLKNDGTSKLSVYKLSDEKEAIPKYVTEEELNKAMKRFDNNDVRDLKEEIKSLKKQVRDLTDDFNDKE